MSPDRSWTADRDGIMFPYRTVIMPCAGTRRKDNGSRGAREAAVSYSHQKA